MIGRCCSLLFFLACALWADELTERFLEQNRQEEPPSAQMTEMEQTHETYLSWEKYLQQHPENVRVQRSILRLGMKLGHTQRLRRFYLGEIRRHEIRSAIESNRPKSMLALLSLHHFLGAFYAHWHERTSEPNQAYLALVHFQEALALSDRFLPAWSCAGRMLERLGGEKNIAASSFCHAKAWELWIQSEFNPTYFRLFPKDIREGNRPHLQDVPASSGTTMKRPKEPSDPGGKSFDEWMVLSLSLSDGNLEEVKTGIEVAAYCCEMMRTDPSEAHVERGLLHATVSLRRLQAIQAQKISEETVKMEYALRQHLFRLYHAQKKYALAEEQKFIWEQVLG